ncbi:hypothetical protein CDN99_26630 [Roseateles aquatilis]|uniref:Nucleotidyl transferase AbiEii/AbiGii toxin family protein n=1 Tax=Roseateles aquatilis TaxID=431061 RepID=A0A246ISL7_9BURK|nr:hypothetical protein CDN99_26630 [Roseateles aquatilis]
MVAHALGALVDEVILVGGCATGMLITDAARPVVRATLDVDLVTEVTPRASYYEFCERLKQRGFRESADAEVICRWHLGGTIVDIMPTEEGILNFTNSWYALAARTAMARQLPGGGTIRVIAAPMFLATKLEAFRSRGGGDYLHHDLEDVINVIDGRPEIVSEVLAAPSEARDFIADEFEALIADPTFDDQLLWLLGGDAGRKPVVLERIRLMTGL